MYMEQSGQAELKVTQAVPFFRVSDMEESLRFYRDGLGFETADTWVVDGKIRWCWLELGDAAVMLQQFPTEGVDSWTPKAEVGEGVSIYFMCTDAIAIYRGLVSRGVRASRPKVGNGMWEVSLQDPDGFRLHFESRTDAPEGSVYSEE